MRNGWQHSDKRGLNKGVWQQETRGKNEKSTWQTTTKTEPCAQTQNKHRNMKQWQDKKTVMAGSWLGATLSTKIFNEFLVFSRAEKTHEVTRCKQAKEHKDLGCKLKLHECFRKYVFMPQLLLLTPSVNRLMTLFYSMRIYAIPVLWIVTSYLLNLC